MTEPVGGSANCVDNANTYTACNAFVRVFPRLPPAPLPDPPHHCLQHEEEAGTNDKTSWTRCKSVNSVDSANREGGLVSGKRTVAGAHIIQSFPPVKTGLLEKIYIFHEMHELLA